jgi:hypothetical protein
MRLRWFLLGIAVGLAIAPARARAAWPMIRDRLASAIDAVLRLGVDASP